MKRFGRRWAFAVVALLAALVPGTASAQEGDREGFLLRIDGDVVIGPDERIGTVVVIDGDLTVQGVVEDAAVVIHGDAVVSGTVGESLVVVDGDAELLATALIHDVRTVDGDLIQAPGSTVTGDINERDDFSSIGWILGLFSVLIWLGMTIVVLAAALIFAAVGGRQLTDSALALTQDAVNVIVGTVLLWVGVPTLAIIVMLTLIGIPLGISIFVFLLPAMLFLGYIVVATRLGLALTKTMGREPGRKPFLGAFVGVVIFQLIVLIPFLGALIAFLAGLWGAGALAFIAFKAAGGRPIGRSAGRAA